MPILNQIELYLEGEYSKEEKKDFLFKSRCICNYWEREINKLKFITDFSRINVYVSDGTKEIKVQSMQSVPFLEVVINYPLDSILYLEENELQGHYIAILCNAISAAESYMPVPLIHSKNILKKFEEGGFQNEWVHAERFWHRKSIESKVVASLTVSEFKLTQLVYLNDQLIAKEVVASTLPREILFDYYLGKLSITRFNILEYKRGKDILTRFDLSCNEFV